MINKRYYQIRIRVYIQLVHQHRNLQSRLTAASTKTIRLYIAFCGSVNFRHPRKEIAPKVCRL